MKRSIRLLLRAVVTGGIVAAVLATILAVANRANAQDDPERIISYNAN
jgi:hypothetical protein